MKRLVGRGALLVCGMGLVVGSVTAASADDDPVPGTAPTTSTPAVPRMTPAQTVTPAEATDPNHPYIPGIPRSRFGALDGFGENLVAPSADQIVNASRAGQWIRIPYTHLAALSGKSLQPRQAADPITSSWSVWEGEAFAIPPGANFTDSPPPRFGEFPSTTVRSVAFGSIPVTFTLHVSQTRDENDLPVPISLVGRNGIWKESGGNYYDSSYVTGQVSIRVSDLVVDGVPVALGTSCRTVRPVEIAIQTEPWAAKDPDLADEIRIGESGDLVPLGDEDIATPEEFEAEPWRHTNLFYPLGGGLVMGSVEVPPFAGCGSGSEDLSLLVTNVASGPGNEIKVRQSPATTKCIDESYYSSDAVDPTYKPSFVIGSGWAGMSAGCRLSAPFPYPTGGTD